MIDLNQLRAEFARYLVENTETRWGLDAALMHVCKLAYVQGMADAPVTGSVTAKEKAHSEAGLSP